LRDHAFSVVTAQQLVQEDHGEGGCPVEHEVCLRLPCDIVATPDNRWTTPLVLADGTPFFLQPGAILQKIVIALNDGNQLDPNVQMILGTLGCNCDTSEPQRFIDCGHALTGCILNQVCSVKIRDVSKNVCYVACATGCDMGCSLPPSCGTTLSTTPGCTAGDTGDATLPYNQGERQQEMLGITILCGVLKTFQIRVFVQYLSTSCGSPDVCSPCFN